MISISKFLPYGKQCIDREDIDAVTKVLSEDFITQGPKITEFEEEIANYVGAKYGVAFNSGTSALHGAYFALGLEKGDEMITTPNTFVATANAGLYLGAKVNFCDVEKQTGNIDASKLEVSKNTKLIAPVHYSGNPVNLKEIADIAEDNNAKIIEDGAHALGAKYDKAHGATLSAVWGSWAEYVYKNDEERFAHYAKKVWGVEEEDVAKAAKEGIRRTVEYFREIHMPTNLKELEIGEVSEEDLRELAMAATLNDTVKLSKIKELTAEDVYQIFRKAVGKEEGNK